MLKKMLVDILVNIKQIILKGILHEPTIVRLNAKGPGIITADIELPSNISLVDPRQYIASVAADEESRNGIFNYAGSKLCS